MEPLPKQKENAEIRGLGFCECTPDEKGWMVASWSDRTMRYQEELASFESILAGVSPGGRWVDPDTPRGQDDVPIVWKWPEEVWNPACVTPTLFSTDAAASDVKQGGCGSCWFLADLCVVAMHPRLMDAVTVAHDTARGVYCFRFFTGAGDERRVCVDSRIPVATRSAVFKPAYAHSQEPGELWPILMEKAMAKLCGGSYQGICGGGMARGLCALLGRVPRSYDRILQGEIDPKKIFADPDQLWGLMHDDLWMGGYLMDAAFLGNPEEDAAFAGGETVGFSGLVEGHCYGVMGLYVVGDPGTRLVKLRNPWGIGHEWTGPWSDGSAQWESLDQEAKDAVGYVDEADGTFFMSIEDLARNLENIGAARVFKGRAEESTGYKRGLAKAVMPPQKKKATK